MSTANVAAHDSTPPSPSPVRPPVVTVSLRATALRIAAAAPCDHRTAMRALVEGVHTIRTLAVREGVERAMRDLGVEVGESPPAERDAAAGATRREGRDGR